MIYLMKVCLMKHLIANHNVIVSVVVKLQYRVNVLIAVVIMGIKIIMDYLNTIT